MFPYGNPLGIVAAFRTDFTGFTVDLPFFIASVQLIILDFRLNQLSYFSLLLQQGHLLFTLVADIGVELSFKIITHLNRQHRKPILLQGKGSAALDHIVCQDIAPGLIADHMDTLTHILIQFDFVVDFRHEFHGQSFLFRGQFAGAAE